MLTVKFGSLSEFRSWDANVSKRKNGLKRCHDNSAASGARASHDREIGGAIIVAAVSTWRRTSSLQVCGREIKENATATEKSVLQVRGREIGENAAAVDDRFWLTKRYHQDCLG